MAKFTINPIDLVYSGDNCYVTIATLIAISQSSYSLLSLLYVWNILLFLISESRVICFPGFFFFGGGGGSRQIPFFKMAISVFFNVSQKIPVCSQFFKPFPVFFQFSIPLFRF